MLPCASYLLASLLAKKSIDMDPHPLANLFKRSNYDEQIASELSALDYLYEVLLYKVIHDSSLIEKHDCNDVSIVTPPAQSCTNHTRKCA